MKRKTHHAGAVASAAMMFAILFAVDGSGANAQNPIENMPVAPATAASAEPATDSQEPEIRFVATPVVQEIPQEPATPSFISQADSLHELVAATPNRGELGRDLLCLAQAIYFESRGEPLAGQLAVARVIINRSESPLFPDDYCSVVTQKAQFSFVRSGRIPTPNTRSDAWERATKIARIAHRDLWQSEADDALFFHADHVRPRWASRKTARATIDNHIFYR